MIQYMFSYVTKTQKGMSAIMDGACREAMQGNMDIKVSIRHTGNAFLNGVETSAQEAACLVLQLPITRMNKKVVFLHASPPDERTFLLKDFKTLLEMDPESEDILSHNILVEYRKRPRCLEKYCLADFALELQIEYQYDVLEEAVEEVEQEELEGVNDSDSEDISERQAFTTDAHDCGFF